MVDIPKSGITSVGMKILIMWQLGAQKLPATSVIPWVIWNQFVKIMIVTDVLSRDTLQKLSQFEAEQVESGYFFWANLSLQQILREWQ